MAESLAEPSTESGKTLYVLVCPTNIQSCNQCHLGLVCCRLVRPESTQVTGSNIPNGYGFQLWLRTVVTVLNITKLYSYSKTLFICRNNLRYNVLENITIKIKIQIKLFETKSHSPRWLQQDPHMKGITKIDKIMDTNV